MSQADDETTGPPAADILARFLESHPGGSEEQFEAWAASQPELKSDPELRSGASKLLQDWLRAEKLLQLGLEFDDGGSVFRRRSGAPREEAAQAPGSEALREGRRIGSFTLTRFIAKGGMGQVWEAEDTELRRTVALKLVLPDRIDARSLELFAREARAGGRLNHPNLVTTLAYGTDDGLSWIAQELVAGSWTIKDSLDALRAEDAVPKGYYREVAELVAKIADGMQAVHDAGVIHRDLKPQNILIAEDDTPKVTDFGLARVTDDSVMSQTGDFAGTWAYMSPEQVTAKRMGLDHRTDIFSLGVVMYELLTLRKPFEGDTTHQIAQEIIYAAPPAATKVRSQCPHELAVIAGKAMEKMPGHRYGTMAELASDLRRHLTMEPILARPPSWIRQLQLWTLRNPTKSVAGGIAAAAFVAVSLLLGENVRARGELEGANKELTATIDERDAAITDTRQQLYVSALHAAQSAMERDDASQVAFWLERCPEGLRGWEWDHLAYTADQSVASHEGWLLAWTDETAYMRVDGAVSDIDLETGGEVGRFDALPDNAEWAAAVSPDGATLAVATVFCRVYLLDTATRGVQHVLEGHKDLVKSLAFSADGTRLVTGSADGAVFVWNPDDGTLVTQLAGPSDDAKVTYSASVDVTFSPVGTHLVTASNDDRVHLWDLESGELLAESPMTWRTDVIAFSSDGSKVAWPSSDADAVQIYGTSTGQLLGVYPTGYTSAIAFSPSSDLLAVGGEDGAVGLWDVGHAMPVLSPNVKPGAALELRLQGGSGRMGPVRFLEEGEKVMAASACGCLLVWDASTGATVAKLRGAGRTVSATGTCLDGSRILARNNDRVRLWDSALGSQEQYLPGGKQRVTRKLLDHSRTKLLAVHENGPIWLWDTMRGELMDVFQPHWPYEIAGFSPTDSRFFIGDQDSLHVYELGAKPNPSLVIEDLWVFAAAFSHDGESIVTGSFDGTVKLWDARSGALLDRLEGHQDRVSAVAVDPTGRLIASGSWDKTVRLWDARTGEELAMLDTATSVFGLTFSPTGEHLVSDSELKIVWDMRTLEAAWSERSLYAGEHAFSPDGSRLYVGPRNRKPGQVLDTGSWEPLRVLDAADRLASTAAFEPGGRLFTNGWDSLALWDAEELDQILVLRGEEFFFGDLAIDAQGSVFASLANGGMKVFFSNLEVARAYWATTIQRERDDKRWKPIVDLLFEQLILPEEVFHALQLQLDLTEQDRTAAVRYARMYHDPSGDELNEIVWPMVDPDRGSTHLTSGQESGSNPELALKLAQGAVRRDPRDANLHDTLAWALLASDRYEEAVTSAERALKLAPVEQKDHYRGLLKRVRSSGTTQQDDTDEDL